MRPSRHLAALFVLATVIAGQQAPAAQAAGPQLVDFWASDVRASSADIRAIVNPGGLTSTARVEYIVASAYQANVTATPPRDGFSGGLRAPVGNPTQIGSGGVDQPYLQRLTGLRPSTAYRYRLVFANPGGTTQGPAGFLTTQDAATTFSLPDGRGWELVSPVGKNGGSVGGPGSVRGGGVFQAAVQGGALTYSSTASFGAAPGAPGGSQYLARRAATGWVSENVTAPLQSGTYADGADGGIPYRLFSTDLATGLLSSGHGCQLGGGECPAANPPLPGSGAPAGYRNYYRRGSASGSFGALIGAADVAGLTLGPEQFDVAFAGASSDLGSVVVSTCAALTPQAVEVAAPGGCDPGAQNLYRAGTGALAPVNLLPGQSVSAPGASLASPAGAVSADGRRIYWTHGGALYLRDGAETKAVDASLGGGASFQVAAADGSRAYLTKGGHLYRYDSGAGSVTDLTPGGGVVGVLGASADGDVVYYLAATGLFVRRGATVTPVAASADAVNYPPASGTARVTADGSVLAFVSSAPLTELDNGGLPQAYVYSAGTGTLVCASCNPTGARSLGAAVLAGANPSAGEPAPYKPRSLSADGSRLFFGSEDALAVQDTNDAPDVYQWQAAGTGGCLRAGGCIGLISSGRSEGGAGFVDASGDGSDVFFTTDGSLVPGDPGAVDIYDARVGGGFPEPPSAIPCFGDACQALPPEPEDPSPGTLVPGRGNPPLSIAGTRKAAAKKAKRKRAGKGQKRRGAKAKKGRRGEARDARRRGSR